MRGKKKTPATIGTVLHKITEVVALQPWADFLAGIDPWKSLGISSQDLFDGWKNTANELFFFSAADPKNAKTPGFEHEYGLVVFKVNHGRENVEKFLKKSLPPGREEGGYIQHMGTKVRHKGLGKYLLSAAERVIAEKQKRVFLFVSESNQAAYRFYKSQGYEELDRATDCFKSGNTEILMVKEFLGSE